MVSKSSAPHSIRFRNDLWDKVMDRAKRDGVTPNEAVVALVEAGLTDGKPQTFAPLTDADVARIAEAGTAAYVSVETRPAKPKTKHVSRLKGEWKAP